MNNFFTVSVIHSNGDTILRSEHKGYGLKWLAHFADNLVGCENVLSADAIDSTTGEVRFIIEDGKETFRNF